ncbi:MAG: adenylate kinase [Chloroflexota bacterium]|nr:adenylate kinase [Chloroflexota bacterium]
MNVVLMGPPGAGKGTQAGTVADLVGITHVASGDLFREAVKNGTEFGRLAQSYMDRGELVPDDLTVGMVMARLQEPDCRHGFVLDGFPRTVNQARALDEKLDREGRRLDQVINLVVPEDVLLARLSGRWLCSSCHTSYHTLFSPPAQPGICDRCGGRLYQRVDDKEETARHRLAVYFDETAPVLEYYRQVGILGEVRGDRPVAEVTDALCHKITGSGNGL